MLRTLVTTAVLATALTTAMVPVAASADERGYGWHDDRGGDRRDWRGDRGDYRRDYRHDYRRDEWRYRRQVQGYYAAPAYGYQPYAYAPAYGYEQPYGGGYYQQESYPVQQGYYEQGYRCHSDGTAGAVIGAIAGGLIGNSVAGRHDRGLGTVLGVGGGAIAGSAIARSGNRC